MIHANHIEGTRVGRGLCESIKSLTEQRLAFDARRMGEQARPASDARQRSPRRSRRQGDQTPHGKAVGATHSTSAPSQATNLSHQSRGLLMSKEARVTYKKLRGDQLLHLAEMSRRDDGCSTPRCEGLAAEALEAYLSAQQEACSKMDDSTTATSIVNGNSTRSSGDSIDDDDNNNNSSNNTSGTLPELHPLRIELALRISSVLLHLLDRPVEAWGVGYPVYLAAAEHPTRLGARGLVITQALRDHLACIEIGEQVEGTGNSSSEQIDTRHDGASAISRAPRAARGAGDGGHAERLVEGEWGFLRMSADHDEARAQGVGRTVSDKLRHLAQVKQARACMEAVTATDRVLLGTMEHADDVKSALKQIFFAYTKRYAKSAQDWSDDGKKLPTQGRKTTSQTCLRQGPFLAWAGFEAVCQDFHIITTPISSVVGPGSRHPTPLDNHDRIHQKPVRGSPLDHQSPPIATPSTSASNTTRQPDARSTVFSGETPISVLLSGVQACIAFVSACTHRSVVAAFPNDGRSDGVVSVENPRRHRISHEGSAEEKGSMSCFEEDAEIWRDMERVILSGSTEVGASMAPGLSFRQFVDALARCGLLGFSGKHFVGTRTHIGFDRECLSAAERVQAMFVTKMRLLDSRHVEARLQHLVRSPPTNHVGEASEEENRLEGIKRRGSRGHALLAGAGHGGGKNGGHTARGSNNAGGPRGGPRKAVVVHPNPATTTAVLGPIQATLRGRETLAG